MRYDERMPAPRAFAFCDETGNGNPDQPLIVCALVCDLERSEIERKLEQKYQEARLRPGFSAMPKYQKFVRQGFHYCNDPIEIQIEFIELLIRTTGIKAFLIHTDRTTLAGVSEVKQLLFIYERLAFIIARRFQMCKSVDFVLEENQSLRPFMGELEDRVRKDSQRITLPECRFQQQAKSSGSLLAISDYVLGIAAKWLKEGMSTDPCDLRFRQLKDIQHLVSQFYSMEMGILINRREKV